MLGRQGRLASHPAVRAGPFTGTTMASGLFPIFLRVESLPILIVGGGRVGARRARKLTEAGARRLTVVSPAFDAAMPEGVTRVGEPFRPDHLAGQRVVFAATSSQEVNRVVCEAAEAAGLLCGRADDPEAGDFITPAVGGAGEVVIAVASGTPAVSRRVRDAAQATASQWAKVARVAGAMRRSLTGDAPARSLILGDLVSDEALEVLRAEGLGGLRVWLRARHGQWRQEIDTAFLRLRAAGGPASNQGS